MKIRQGFVSNSSSTSFCVMGYECPPEFGRHEILKLLGYVYERDSDEEHYAWYEIKNGDFKIIDKEDTGGEGYFIGYSVVQNEDYGLTNCDVEVQDILEQLQFLEDSGVETGLQNCRIISGQEGC